MRNKPVKPRGVRPAPAVDPESGAVYVAPGVRRFIPHDPVARDGWSIAEFALEDAEDDVDDRDPG